MTPITCSLPSDMSIWRWIDEVQIKNGLDGSVAMNAAMHQLAEKVMQGVMPVSAWQPIDTAPKDGTIVDVWAGDERVADVFWSLPDDSGKSAECCWCISVYEINYGYRFDRVGAVSHWMPIPSGPKETA